MRNAARRKRLCWRPNVHRRLFRGAEPESRRSAFGLSRREPKDRYPPGNPAVGDEPGNLAAKAARDHRPPGDQGESLGVLDQGVAAGGALHRLAVGAADRVAGHGHAVTSADEVFELRTLRAQGYALVMGFGSSVSVADLMGAFAP